jgi:uncharacterized protein YbbK (DUF523 family)
MSEQQNPKYLISACLVGCNCRYDGKNQAREEMTYLYSKGEAVAICPEELAGLGTPRIPCEKVGSKILSVRGDDKSASYQLGAEKAFEIVSASKIECAFLKSKSPMCGYDSIYDGTFSGRLTAGNGVFADLLIEKGIPVKSVE